MKLKDITIGSVIVHLVFAWGCYSLASIAYHKVGNVIAQEVRAAKTYASKAVDSVEATVSEASK